LSLASLQRFPCEEGLPSYALRLGGGPTPRQFGYW
jgi:hypothetical protein